MKEIILLATSMLLSAQILAAPTEKAVLEQYADVAHAMYEDALITARALQQAVGRVRALDAPPP